MSTHGEFEATPFEISKAHQLTVEKFDEAQRNNLVDQLHAKAVIFSSLENPEVLGWLEFIKISGTDNYIVTHEHEKFHQRTIHEGALGISGLKSITYAIGATPANESRLEVLGFKLIPKDTDEDREYAETALMHGHDPFGIGQEATADCIHEEGLAKFSLSALHGILLDTSEGMPTLEITNLPRALRLLKDMAKMTSPLVQCLNLDLQFSELVRPDTEHRISEI
jgi:hypothetical protein